MGIVMRERSGTATYWDGCYKDGWQGLIVSDALWDLCQATEVPTAPAWDGHTSLDVLERLRRDLEGTLRRRH